MELLKLDPDLARRVVVVAPRRRRRKLASLLRNSHYIGFPLYLENKLSYVFYDELLKLYDSLAGTAVSASRLLAMFDDVAQAPEP